MTKKIVAGVIIPIVALVICFAPIKTAAYTVTVDYQDTETYYVNEPYEHSYTTKEKTLLWPDLETSHLEGKIDGRRQTIGIFAKYANTHDFPIEASFVLLERTDREICEGDECHTEKGEFKRVESSEFHAEPGETVSTKFYFEQERNIFRHVRMEPDPMYVEKEVTTTEYRQVEKQRTVTKQRPETRYKKVTLLDYLLHY